MYALSWPSLFPLESTYLMYGVYVKFDFLAPFFYLKGTNLQNSILCLASN